MVADFRCRFRDVKLLIDPLELRSLSLVLIVGGDYSKIAKFRRQLTMPCPGGTLFPYHFDSLFFRRSGAHRHRVARESVSPHAIQFLRHRARFYFSDSVLVDSRPGVGTVPDY